MNKIRKQWVASCQKNHSIIYRKIIILSGWLCIWQIAALALNHEVLLVGPLDTLAAIGKLVAKLSFWKTILFSMTRIMTGFFLGLILGIFFAITSVRYKNIEEILRPVVTLIKSIPVASFVVLFLIWWNAKVLSVVISLMVVFPTVYFQMMSGIHNADQKLLEMAKVFQMPLCNRIFYIYRPSCRPFLESAMKVSVGMGIKSGVAAEVIATPSYSMGESLYMAKIYLDTANVLAWTTIIIILCSICEKIIIFLWNAFCNWQPGCKINIHHEEGKQPERIVLEEVTKTYDGRAVIEQFSHIYQAGETYLFQSPSGSGKTTLFRLITGLEKPDYGTIQTSVSQYGYLFQEDRLCEDYDALLNVGLVSCNPAKSAEMLQELLPEEALGIPCKELSGGMKRRVCLVRAFSTQSPIIILDEPFNGLDEDNIRKVKEFIKKHGKNKCVLLATHI